MPPRKQQIKIAALNVVTHPHSAEQYAALFEAAFKAQGASAVRLMGDQYGLVLSWFPVNKQNILQGIEGEIVRFMNISADEPWFNINKAEEASKAEKSEIKIPTHLRPKMKKFRYLFDPVKHRVVFVTQYPGGNVSPELAKKLFFEFLNHPSFAKIFPSAQVTVEQSRQGLTEVFGMYRLEHLTIDFSKPNADEGDLNEAAILKELDEQNISSVHSDFDAEGRKSIEPNHRNKLLAQIAVSNGYVEGTGRDEEGNRKRINTQDKPLIKGFKERLDKVDIVSWLRQKAADLIAAIVKPDES